MPEYKKRLGDVERSTTSSTGRNTATPSGRTNPWMLHGTPSRNGWTRILAETGTSAESAARASSSVTTQRTRSPPPFMPCEASADHTVPWPASRFSAAARSRSGSASTTRAGARLTPAASHSASLRLLSSSARNDRGRPPSDSRPRYRSTRANGLKRQRAVLSGSNASTACRAPAGGSAANLIQLATSSLSVACSGPPTTAALASSGPGSSPVPVPSATTRTASAPHSRSCRTRRVAPARTPPTRTTLRPRTSSAQRSASLVVGSVVDGTVMTRR